MAAAQGGDPALQERELYAVVADCLEVLERGGQVDQEAPFRRYPEHAAELAGFLADREQVGRVAAPLRAALRWQRGPAWAIFVFCARWAGAAWASFTRPSRSPWAGG